MYTSDVKTIDIFQGDAFTKSIFKGNPAAVCPVLEWPSDALMQWIATENNVSETAFVLLGSNPLEIRWFSPTIEVDLCGHATLATARILFDEYLPSTETTIIFQYKGGLIEARTEGDLIYLDFPNDEPKKVNNIGLLNNILQIKPDSIYKGKFRRIVFTVFPMAMITSVPARTLIFGPDIYLLSSQFLVTIVFLCLTRLIWIRGVKLYESASS